MDLLFAAVEFSGIGRVIVRLGGMILAIAPAAIVLSYVVCALIWVVSGGNSRMVKWAREQFIATSVVFAVLGGYYIIKEIALQFGKAGMG